MTYLLRVYVGPTLVGPLAEHFRGCGMTVSSEGTAHVFLRFTTNDANPELHFLNTLRSYGTTFGLRANDVVVMQATQA